MAIFEDFFHTKPSRADPQPVIKFAHPQMQLYTGEDARSNVAVTERPTVMPPPPLPAKPVGVTPKAEMSLTAIEEYTKVAKEVGVDTSELDVERFKLFMVKHNLPIYDLKTVVNFMDKLAERDNPTGYGWHWLPLREKDKRIFIHFGKPSSQGRQYASAKTAGSDYFNTQSNYARVYDKRMPLHALKRVALIEKNFVGHVVFAVSDYATHPHIKPDPFLLAIIPNQSLHEGVGRFVIDVWDEPGFGLDLMLR